MVIMLKILQLKYMNQNREKSAIARNWGQDR